MFGDIEKYWNRYGEWIMSGVVSTLEISAICVVLGLLLGILIGFARHVHITRKDNLVTKTGKYGIKFVLDGYLSFFRYTPFMVQAFFFYYVFFLKLDSYTAGIIVMTLNTSAYIAVVVEGGIKSVDVGQYNAGRSLGLSHARTFTKIVLPQAFRNMVPSLSNQFVDVIKATSVLSVIGVKDLLFWIEKGNSASYDVAAGFTISMIIYFFICLSFAMLLRLFNWLLERRR